MRAFFADVLHGLGSVVGLLPTFSSSLARNGLFVPRAEIAMDGTSPMVRLGVKRDR